MGLPVPIMVPRGSKYPSAFLPISDVIELVTSLNAMDDKDKKSIIENKGWLIFFIETPKIIIYRRSLA